MDFPGGSGYSLFILGLLTIGIAGQISPCPEEASTCCQCLTTPGCAWRSSPTNTSQPRCTSLLLAAGEGAEGDSGTSSGGNALVIQPSENRALNPNRRRLIRPQGGILNMTLALRKEVPIQVLARTRRVRIIVAGPADSPHFSIEKGNDISCSRRFKLRERTYVPRNRGSGSRGRNRAERSAKDSSRQKRIYVDCIGSGPGVVHSLRLVVDMNTCYADTRQIRMMVRERRARKFRLGVNSACSCPCQSNEAPQTDGTPTGTCSEGEEFQQCLSDTEQASFCSGVNDYCRRDQNQPACSGRGTCICGVCMCNSIPVEGEPILTDSTVAMMDGVSPSRPLQRYYSGAYCQCDDVSCPKHQGQVCGGEARGACHCGRCLCRDGYIGDDCGVVISNETCIAPSGSLCNRMGECVNGRCVCHSDHVGMYCELCPTCRGMCSRVAPCIECLVGSAGSENPQAICQSDCIIEAAPPMTFTPSDGEWPNSADFCVIERNSCRYEFAYMIQTDGEMGVYYKNERHCIGERREAV